MYISRILLQIKRRESVNVTENKTISMCIITVIIWLNLINAHHYAIIYTIKCIESSHIIDHTTNMCAFRFLHISSLCLSLLGFKCLAGFQRCAFHMIYNPFSALAVMICILLNTLTMALDHHGMDREMEICLRWANYVSLQLPIKVNINR